MNRRDLFRKVVGTLAAAGVSTPVVASVVPAPARYPDLLGAPPPAAAPALAVLEFDEELDQDQTFYLQRHMAMALEQTPFEGLRIVVLSRGARLTFLDASGRVLNERLEA